MSGRRARKLLLAAAVVLLAAVLCSCSPLMLRELPLRERLTDDVMEYLHSLAGNDVEMFKFTVDQRAYDEAKGALRYECTADFAWDEFNDGQVHQIAVSYALEDGAWNLLGIQSDIGQADIDARLLMHGLFVEPVEIPEAVRTALTGADAAMSDTLYDFTARLGGVVYRFPCNFSDFTSSGWQIAETSAVTELRTVSPQTYISVPMVNGDETVTLYVANQSAQTLYAGEGVCAGLVARPQSGSALFASGITTESTAEDVLAAFGDPSADEIISGGRRLTYQASANSRIRFLFTGDGAQIDLFTLEDQTKLAQTSPLFDVYAFGFTLDGADYALPTRLDTLLGDGWAIAGTERTTDVIHWYESKSLTLAKGESSVDVTVSNLSMGDLRLYAASVTGITLDQSRASFALVLGVGDARTEISLVQPAETVLGALGEPSAVETDAGSQVVTYTASGGRYLRLTLGTAAAVAQLQADEASDTTTDVLEDIAFKVNLSGNAYTLPSSAAEFKNKAWVPDRGWLQPVKAGSYVKMFMENRRAEGIIAYLANTGKETAKLEECTLAGLYADSGAVSVLIGRSVKQGAAIGEAFNIFGIPTFDLQDGDARYLVYGTSVDRFLCVRCVGDLVDALWIVCFTYQ